MSDFRHFVSAGWPYLYDIPGLHNCMPMLFADVCARFHRYLGHDVYFLCGADEHGARTEYVARGYGTTPQVLLDAKFNATVPLLKRLSLSFDDFGRTGDPFHKQFVQEFLRELSQKRALVPGMQRVPWCACCKRHLPDRFLEGICPSCASKTYGNQCNNKKNCSRLLEPDQILDSHCAVCAGPVEWKEEAHLFFPLGNFEERLKAHAQSPVQYLEEVHKRVQKTFSDNPSVCVTRDTAWGIATEGLPGKTVYSWVDSLLAKVSMLEKRSPALAAEYWKNPGVRRHFFLGMDGTPFYGALFPALLLASERGYSIENWNIFPNEVLIYEGGICSKSTGTGIWLEEALATLPADFWRFYIFLVQAAVEMGSERDVDFRWERFCESVNQWMIEGLKQAANPPDRTMGVDEVASASTSAIIQKTTALLHAARWGEAFHTLMTGLTERPSTEKTRALTPLLACFLPESAAALAQGKVPFDLPRLYAPQVQMDYQDLIDARRAKRVLREEITDARADALCVCPVNLREQ